MDNRIIDQYTFQLERLSEDENKSLPVRCVATNTDDKSTAEAWMTREMCDAFLVVATGIDADYWMQQLADNRYVDLMTPHPDAKEPVRYVLNAPELMPFGFAQDNLRPWRVEA